MAKFKVGDKVIGSRSGANGTSDDYGIVVKLIPDGNYVTVKSGKYGRDIDYHESDLRLANSCASTNPVVANALAARTLNSAVAANADTEESIDAEAKKLAKEVLALASKFDALQKRLNRIGLYYTDYQAAANDLRNVHSVIS